jgi:crotonobetainyl-CoA:carnitine CoA-transferase CaiB-like acyl-CoA transferase
MSGPLSHVRVLDLSRIMAGPWSTQILADLGADVIKVERPGGGDDTRSWGPPYLKDRDGRDTRESAYYLSVNRGKRSITVSLDQPAGQALVRQLAATVDIVIENFKVDTLARFGLDYASLSQVNPRLIYCSITGFGQTGPRREVAAYDFAVQGMGGLLSVTGERDDLPGGGPQKVGVPVVDMSTGLYATIGILAALARRAETGAGEYLDVAMLDVQAALLANQAMNYLTTGNVPKRNGNRHPNIQPQDVFQCSDGAIVLAVGNDAQYLKLCEVLGEPAMGSDPRYQTNANRVRHRDTLLPWISAQFRTNTRAHWVSRLEAAGVPCGPINNIAEVLDDEQLRHRQMQIGLPHPLAGTVQLLASPLRFSSAPLRHERHPPLLGEHTDEVLREAGLSAADIAALRAGGAI